MTYIYIYINITIDLIHMVTIIEDNMFFGQIVTTSLFSPKPGIMVFIQKKSARVG